MPKQDEDKRNWVIEILKSYPRKKKQISLLRYELEHPTHISEEELIESLSLSKAVDGGVRTKGRISDKTMMIALQYQDAAERMNSGVVVEIAQELAELEAEVDRIDYYLGLLDERQERVLRKWKYYIEQNSWTKIEEEERVSQRTLSKWRDEGVRELSEMFGFLERLKGDHG